LLGLGAAAERDQDVEALALVEALLLADPNHGASVGSVGAAAERDLVHDGGAVHQPSDGADIGATIYLTTPREQIMLDPWNRRPCSRRRSTSVIRRTAMITSLRPAGPMASPALVAAAPPSSIRRSTGA